MRSALADHPRSRQPPDSRSKKPGGIRHQRAAPPTRPAAARPRGRSASRSASRNSEAEAAQSWPRWRPSGSPDPPAAHDQEVRLLVWEFFVAKQSVKRLLEHGSQDQQPQDDRRDEDEKPATALWLGPTGATATEGGHVGDFAAVTIERRAWGGQPPFPIADRQGLAAPIGLSAEGRLAGAVEP